MTSGPHATDELLPALYRELRQLAAGHLARLRPGETLQPTALVHEAYLRLLGSDGEGWCGRGHFFGAAAEVMREVIVDHVRRKTAAKRGGGAKGEPLDPEIAVAAEGLGPDDVLSVNAALTRLEAEHPRKAQIVVMRYFAGLSEDEIAEALGVTSRTVERDWRFARAYLRDALSRECP